MGQRPNIRMMEGKDNSSGRGNLSYILRRMQDQEDDGPPPRSVLVVGGSGAGKRTLLHLLCGEGEIRPAAELPRQRNCTNRCCHLNRSSLSFSTPASPVPAGSTHRLGFC